jgi:hypothetical protein
MPVGTLLCVYTLEIFKTLKFSQKVRGSTKIFRVHAQNFEKEWSYLSCTNFDVMFSSSNCLLSQPETAILMSSSRLH